MIPQLVKTFVAFLTFSFFPLSALSISNQEAKTIAKRIWINECKGTFEGLTCWNAGEEFASLGIGHFIWYPAGKKDRYVETFPDLLQWLKKNNIEIPAWIEKSHSCPWNSKMEFEENIMDSKMIELRKLLANTFLEQALFMVSRLEKLLPNLMQQSKKVDQMHTKTQFERIANAKGGTYVLIDYLNFKGDGLSEKERYNGKGWGLLQVLQGMNEQCSKDQPLKEFVRSAKTILTQRVNNAPSERNEMRWLKGWFNRLETYLQD